MKNGLQKMALFPMLMMIISICVGIHRYTETRDCMQSDLTRALQHLVSSEHHQTHLSTLLSSLPSKGVVTPLEQKSTFHSMLSSELLRDTAHYSLCVFCFDVDEQFPEQARVCSDTLFWNFSQSGTENKMVAFKAFANPSVASIFFHSRPVYPLAAFFSSLCLLAFLLRWHPCKQVVVSSKEANHLVLTPMQEQLMELFRDASGHTLTKEQICAALWPKKQEPENTLYTFISRFKTALYKQSTWRIENRRGREYVLIDESQSADI